MNTELVDRLRAAGCVFAEDEAALLSAASSDPGQVEALAARRIGGEPLEYVLGWVDFAGLRLAIEPGVFVPRRRSEALVAQAVRALSRLRESRGESDPVVVDLCCGCGALGAAVRAADPGVQLFATDLGPAAVACARHNIGANVYQGDLFEPLPPELRGRIDVLLANVPYVPTADISAMPREARDYEPLLALDGGPDGLDVLRRVAAQAPRWLASKGTLLSEIAEPQAGSACAVLAAAGLAPSVARDADREATVLIGARGQSSC